jgi:hypothetical protein
MDHATNGTPERDIRDEDLMIVLGGDGRYASFPFQHCGTGIYTRCAPTC